MADIQRISTHTPWEPEYGYSRAVKAGNLVVVSGTTATDESGTIVGINQMYVQARRAIENLARALARTGLTLKDVIRTRVYVTDMRRFTEVARAHREFFADAPPASTAVEVRRLVHPDMLIEIEADALAGDARGASMHRKPRPAKAAPAKTRAPRAVKKGRGRRAR